MLWGRITSPHAHARIVEVDISEALTSPGVHAVLTHDDVPGQKRYGLEFPDQPCSPSTVCATSASRCLSPPSIPSRHVAPPTEIRVVYEELDPVVDPERATEQAPIHDERWTHGHGYLDDDRPNVVRRLVIRHGDPDARADVSVEGVYELGIKDQAFLGPSRGSRCPTATAASTSTSRRSGCTSTGIRWPRASTCRRSACASTSPASAARSASARTSSMQVHSALLALHTNAR